MTINKKAWIFSGAITLIAVVGTLLYSYTPPLFQGDTIQADIDTLITTIKSDRQDNGKYKYRPKEIINGVEYEVHEYLTAKNEAGYVIYMTKEKNNKIYKKAVVGGVEQYRAYDWIMVQDNASTTTP
tara:strand:- start:812 stop:1192 length:381 start_codon:yes stop_codon:yes gene_type:complete